MNKSGALAVMLVALVTLTACTRIYTHNFVFETIDNFDSPRTLYTTVREYMIERNFPIDRETTNSVSFQLATIQGKINPAAPSDYFTLNLNESNRVEVELVRISSGGDFSKQQITAIVETLEKRVLERSGKRIAVKHVQTKRQP